MNVVQEKYRYTGRGTSSRRFVQKNGGMTFFCGRCNTGVTRHLVTLPISTISGHATRQTAATPHLRLVGCYNIPPLLTQDKTIRLRFDHFGISFDVAP